MAFYGPLKGASIAAFIAATPVAAKTPAPDLGPFVVGNESMTCAPDGNSGTARAMKGPTAGLVWEWNVPKDAAGHPNNDQISLDAMMPDGHVPQRHAIISGLNNGPGAQGMTTVVGNDPQTARMVTDPQAVASTVKLATTLRNACRARIGMQHKL